MASREGDTGLWLHNKLGSADDLWSASGFCSQLNKDKLLSIQDCFHNLQPYVKVKLLHSFLHLPKRNIDDVSFTLVYNRCAQFFKISRAMSNGRYC